MRILWRSTTSLLRQYPILWLPVLVAEIVNFNLRWFERLLLRPLRHQLILWFSQAHSVLSTTPVPIQPTGSIMIKTALLTAPLEWGMQFLCAAVTVASLVATAAILQSIAKTGRGSLRAVIAPITSSRRRILILSLQFWGLNMILSLQFWGLNILFTSLLELLSPLVFSIHNLQAYLGRSNLAGSFFSYLWVLPVTLFVCYIIAPLEARLLQSPESTPAPDQARRARVVAILVALGLCVFNPLTGMAESYILQMSLLAFSLKFFLIELLFSLIRTAPYALLFIAFYLIANPESPLVGASVAPPEEDAAPSLETSL
jgi:hypothetical protein